MNETGNPIDDLRESFERITPNEAQRARWMRKVEEALSVGGGTRSRFTFEPIPWRLVWGSAIAAGIALALVLVDFSMSGRIESDLLANAITTAQEQLETSWPNSTAIDAALAPSPALVAADERARMLLDMEWPEIDALDPGLREVWDQVTGAILRPITRLSAQLETGV